MNILKTGVLFDVLHFNLEIKIESNCKTKKQHNRTLS